MEDTPNKELSIYNEAAQQIFRLHNLWMQAEYYIAKGLLSRWHFILDAIWRELYADALRNTKRAEFINSNKEKRNACLASWNSRAKLYEALNTRHEFLKYLQDNVGKGGKYGDEDELNL